jgi:hypothetical protein
MKIPERRPKYNLEAIRSIGKLSLALGYTETRLSDLADRADFLYRKAKAIKKPDGSIRQPFDALPPLKAVQRRIKDRLLKRVEFPNYLTGSLKGSDYRVNAAMHAGSKIIICEDIEGFFLSTSSDRVKDIWQHFFGFSEDVAELLTCLTTKEKALPQGAVTSSYLANLAFWERESTFCHKLAGNEIIYSRYVDDITVSSKHVLTKNDQTKIIAQIYGMLSAQGYRAKRSKHEIFTSGRQMRTTKLVVNRRAALPPQERKNIRAAVYALEQKVTAGERGSLVTTEMNRVTSRVGRLGGLHPTESVPLKVRLKTVRQLLHMTSQTLVLPSRTPLNRTEDKNISMPPPWEV